MAIVGTAGGLVLLATVVLVELLARAMTSEWLDLASWPGVRQLANRNVALRPYQVPSDGYGRHWVLRPGWSASGPGDANVLLSSPDAAYVGPSINSAGFKGPEIPQDRSSLPRLLFVGDSVTFGLNAFDYVRVVESRLSTRAVPTICINAGVEGYATRNAWLERGRYRAQHPDVVVLLLGWNDLYGEDGSYGTAWRSFESIRMVRKLVRSAAALADPLGYATSQRWKTKRVDPADPAIARYANYTPPFLGRLEQLGEALSDGGGRIVLATLPALYRDGDRPSALALERGHLPEFTDNPLVLAAMTRQVNDGIRQLAARRGWQLLDLDLWAAGLGADKASYFSDSVHLNQSGLHIMGQFVADWLDSHGGLPSTNAR